MKKSMVGILAIAAALTMSACKGGGGGGISGGTVVEYTWYDVFGNACGSLRPGCTYVDSGYTSEKALWWEDPFYNAWAQPEWAYEYDTDYDYFDYFLGHYGYNGVFYDYYTGRAINEGTADDGRDIISQIGGTREDTVQRAGADVAARYGLSQEAGVRMARALADYNLIAKNRERTQSDLENLTKKIYGVSLKDVVSALSSNDKAKQNVLVNQAAEHLQTSPENMKIMLKNIYKEEIL